MTVDVLIPCQNMLGESPLWCPRRARLYWVDIRAPALLSCAADGSDVQTWTMPETIGSFAFCAGEDFIVALQSGLFRYKPATGLLSLLAAPDAHLPHHRFNEGKCDPSGRFWAGTMNDVVREPTGSLFRLDAQLRCTRIHAGISVPNSMAWSPNGVTMYFADSERRVIEAFEFDADEGRMGTARLFADLRHGTGRPDGATVDADGCLWSAEVVSGRVVRYAPDGREIAAWKLPVSKVTSLAFGGNDLRTLYITSGRYRVSAEELATQPLAGALFALHAPVCGLPATVFRG